MSPTPSHVAVLVGLLVLAGCVGASPVATEIEPNSSATPTQTETVTPSDEAGVTANLVLNNIGNHRYNVSLYVVDEQPESKALFPLNVTYRNGSTVTVGETDELPYIPRIFEAVRIEPANGTVAAVHQQLSPRSTLRIDVQNAPEDAMWLGVMYRTGTQEASITSWGLSTGICTGSDAVVYTINESFSSSATCGNVTDIAFHDSLSRHTVTAGNTAEVSSG